MRSAALVRLDASLRSLTSRTSLRSLTSGAASLAALLGAWGLAVREAAADPTTSGAAEAGLELDSNVRRIDTNARSNEQPSSAPLLRLAARGERLAELGPGLSLISLSSSLRQAVGGDVTSENFAQLGGDAQWTLRLRDGDVRGGPRLSYRDAFPLSDNAADRTFRSIAVEGLVVLYGESARFTAAGGPRFFKFKPSEDATWRGLGASVRGDFPLWRAGEDDERTLDLTVSAMMEQRAYRGIAYTDRCTADEGYQMPEDCFFPTARKRGDRVHRLGATLAYAGGVVASADAVATVVDSNSAGRSWMGLRVRTAVTAELPKGYLTGIATLQLESYADHLLVAREQEYFDVLDNDNRSSLEVRFGLPVSKHAVLEVRAAHWSDISGDINYSRTLASVGVVWTGRDDE